MEEFVTCMVKKTYVLRMCNITDVQSPRMLGNTIHIDKNALVAGFLDWVMLTLAEIFHILGDSQDLDGSHNGYK